ncbi:MULTISPECIES: TPM domain-containing protein [Bacillaceae]|uniref:TPM domain-containing protein n=1 Tax=Evansella alkalicola TaxID=745819 RepID=A0ABS6JXN5_9BACI|nr:MULTISPECIES: TPM domain-containing protein [Bacillaceae]MBU9722992.1 TPM domain-containing protein [Bacillus alkalicola]
MNSNRIISSLLLLFLLFIPAGAFVSAETSSNQVIYDYAEVLSAEEKGQLEVLAREYADKRKTDFIFLSTRDTGGRDVEDFMGDFYDDERVGYDKPHGNAAILTIDLDNGDVYSAGFGIAEDLLDDHRLDLIMDEIIGDLRSENYASAFETFIIMAEDYMGYRAGISPNNLIFEWWFQILVAAGVAGVVVGGMAYNSGGKVTVNKNTYMDAENSRVVSRRDTYLRKTVSKRRKPSSNNSRGGRGGGGVTRGGRSHSGSRRSL